MHLSRSSYCLDSHSEHPCIKDWLPKRATLAILGDIPDTILRIHNIVDFEDILILHSLEFLVDHLLLLDVLSFSHIFSNFSDRQRIIDVRVIDPIDLDKEEITCAKLP